METEKRYLAEPLPAFENVERFAIPFFPEKFTPEEESYLRPFFSNLDRPVYVISHLPEEVIGALTSRYSRATESLRRLFLKEYVGPVIHPEQMRGWHELSSSDQSAAETVRDTFKQVVEFLNRTGGIDRVVNIQQGRKFFDVWLSQYGDDSIAEMGMIHLCIEGMSNVALEELVNKRVGVSPLVKSTRYVSFAQKRPDGEYQYVVPGEIIGTPYENEYRVAMDLLFDTYSGLAEPYLEYIEERYPKGEDETDVSFKGSRKAKRFDDLRDLLPFATQINGAFLGNGRAFEDIVNRLMYHPVGELRWLGQTICNELEKVVPSFVRRPKTERGAQIQIYRNNLRLLRSQMQEALRIQNEDERQGGEWARLIGHTKDADIAVLSAFLFAGERNVSLSSVRTLVEGLSVDERARMLSQILAERKFGNADALREEVRFRKVPRAFENAHYLFEVWGRGGDFRDIHRHRMATEEHQAFNSGWGYDLEREVVESPYYGKIKAAVEFAGVVSRRLETSSPYLASYAVPFGYIQHWYLELSARGIYWPVELRTGPQGRPHYRMIFQQIAQAAIEADPAIFSGLMVDNGDYRLSRRKSEIKLDLKKGSAGR